MTSDDRAQKKPVSTDPVWRRIPAEFWAGFRDLAPLSLAVAVATFLACVIGMVWLFSPRTMAGPWGDYIPKSSLSADAFATVEAVRVGAANSENPQILIFGSSTLAQAFGRGEVLEKRIELGTGVQWDFHSLTTPLQSPLDKLTLLEAALANRTEASPHAIVVVGAGVQRLNWTPERIIEHSSPSRIGLRSEWADEELRNIGGTPEPRTGVYVLDNQRFVLLNGMAAMSRAAVQRPAHRMIDVYARGEKKDWKLEAITAGIIEHQDNLQLFMEQHQRILDRIESVPNVTLVFVDEPLLPDPAQKGALNDIADRFSEEMLKLTADGESYYWPIMSSTDLKADDFFDPLHLFRGDAQKACQETLANRLVDLVVESGIGNG